LTNTKSSKKPSKASVRKIKPTKKEIAEVIEKTKSKAEEYARDPNKAKKLLVDAVKKAKSYDRNKGPLAEVWGYLTALFRLLRAYIRGDYRDIPWGPIVLVIAAIIYFVSAIDLIPDILPGIGLVDDAAVIGLVITQTKFDLDNFLSWEIERSNNEYDAANSQVQPT
jgi:uncharacterized membrane protein YkvA (DUF1232 family)